MKENGTVLKNLLEHMINVHKKPPEVFKDEVKNHFGIVGKRIACRLSKWFNLDVIPDHCKEYDLPDAPEFPLADSKGFRISLKNTLEKYWKSISNDL